MSTEALDPRTIEIDEWSSLQAITFMLDGQQEALAAIKPAVPALARAAEASAERLGKGGRLGYAGAGTSGRLAMQDGIELTPTFDWPQTRLAFFIAGGLRALSEAVERAEDDEADAQAQIERTGLDSRDVLVAVAASGRTPFTCTVAEEARRRGALTIAVVNNANTRLQGICEHTIVAETGAEPIAGSTRLRAGTAQKVVLNLLSTATMLRLGFVYRGRMVNVRSTNAKLDLRALQMVRDLTGADALVANSALVAARGSVGQAILIVNGAEAGLAARLFAAAGQNLRSALTMLAALRSSSDH